MKYIRRICYICFLVLVVTVTYAFIIEPHRFVIHEESISIQDSSTSSISIVQISDTEISEHYQADNLEKHIKEINALAPDLIVFTGDLFNNYSKYAPYDEVQRMLTDLKATYGKYAIYGNKDYGGGAVRIYEQIMSDSGFQVLRNEVTQLTIKNQQVSLVGMDSYLMGAHEIDKVKAQLIDSDTTIVLAHEPEMIDTLSFPYDLILCGHTHGGQVAIPLLQDIFKISDTPYIKGLYQIQEDKQLYVDSGMGTSRLPIRVFNPPQISYLTIKL